MLRGLTTVSFFAWTDSRGGSARDEHTGREMNIVAVSTAWAWRAWLARNSRSGKDAWLVIRRARSTAAGMRYTEAIEHALCYGWIDSHARKRDADSFYLRFSPRRPRSKWSRVNRQRAAKLTGLGLMTEHGQAAIERAKATGTWLC